MTDRNQHVLVRLIPDGECIGIRTFSREIGRRGRFLIIRSSLEEWLCGNRKRAYYDMDCGNILRIRADGHALLFTIFWLASRGNRLEGHAQQFCIPAELVIAALRSEAPARYLYVPQMSHARIELQNCARVMRDICAEKHIRRAFSKAMRDCFHWPGDHVRLYPDVRRDFYFTAQDGLCGGLILHESETHAPHGQYRKLYYSVHT